MTIGIIGAMHVEVAALKAQIENLEVTKQAGIEFFKGTLRGKEVVVAQCGIGKVNAAICTQILINKFNVTHVLNTGVAGALDENLDVTHVVISDELMQHDFDTTAVGDKKGVVCGLQDETFVADRNLIEVAKKAALEVLDSNMVHIGNIATGDQFVSCEILKKEVRQLHNAACIEMEGGSIAHVCYLNKVPFVVIRAISDKAGEEAHLAYDKFVEIAAKNSTIIVERFLELI